MRRLSGFLTACAIAAMVSGRGGARPGHGRGRLHTSRRHAQGERRQGRSSRIHVCAGADGDADRMAARSMPTPSTSRGRTSTSPARSTISSHSASRPTSCASDRSATAGTFRASERDADVPPQVRLRTAEFQRLHDEGLVVPARTSADALDRLRGGHLPLPVRRDGARGPGGRADVVGPWRLRPLEHSRELRRHPRRRLQRQGYTALQDNDSQMSTRCAERFARFPWCRSSRGCACRASTTTTITRSTRRSSAIIACGHVRASVRQLRLPVRRVQGSDLGRGGESSKRMPSRPGSRRGRASAWKRSSGGIGSLPTRRRARTGSG